MLIFTRTGPTRIFMRNFPLALLIACLLSACGLKGPLIMPGQKPPAAAATATPADDKKLPGPVAP